jgi:hypothetical protein
VTVVATDHRNIKITTAGDMSLAAVLVKEMGRKPKGPALGAFDEAQW